MKKISDIGRRALRKILLILGAATISVLFAACYGMPMNECTGEEECNCLQNCDCYNCPHDRNRPDDTGNNPVE